MRLYQLAKKHLHTGGGDAAAHLLLGLLNGRRFPLDLKVMAAFDMGNREAAMVVIQMDAFRVRTTVPAILDSWYGDGFDTEGELEHWAYALRLIGRRKKDQLCKLDRIRP